MVASTSIREHAQILQAPGVCDSTRTQRALMHAGLGRKPNVSRKHKQGGFQLFHCVPSAHAAVLRSMLQ